MTLFSFIFLIIFGSNKPLPTSEIADLHAFHISKTDISHKTAEKSLQITMHIFIDDLELALEKQGHKKLFVGTDKEVAQAKNLIEQYLRANFMVSINGKNCAYQWLGKETSTDKQALWIYLEATNIKEVKQIGIENKVLTDVFTDQKNIVQVNVPAKKQGYFLLDRSKTRDACTF